MSTLFDKIAQETPDYVNDFVDTSFEISDRIAYLLEEKGMQQKDLANALGKKESEISKWLTGTHNFTLLTLSKIKAALGAEIIEVLPNKATAYTFSSHLIFSRFAENESNNKKNNQDISGSCPEVEDEEFSSLAA